MNNEVKTSFDPKCFTRKDDPIYSPSHYAVFGVEDLEKARVYLDWLIEHLERPGED